MKKTSKIFKILIAVVVIVAMLGGHSQVKAAGLNDILSAATSWMKTGNEGATSLMDGKDENQRVDFFANKLIGIGQILVAIGVGTLIIVSVIMAIKWITATPDKKAKLQQQLIGLVVAAFVIFGAIGIWNLVRGIMGNVESKLEATIEQDKIYVAQMNDSVK